MFPSTAERFERRDRLQALGEEITELSAHIDAAQYQFLLLLEEYDREKGWQAHGLASAAEWLNWQCGISMGPAREKVRVARALPELPKISEAFRLGRISYSKVRAMTRVATAENEDVLLNVALHGTAAHVERQVSDYRRYKRAEALQLENQRHDHRKLSWLLDDQGYWVFRGRFTPEQGAIISKAFEAALDQLFDEDTDFTNSSVAQRQADAMERVAEQFLAGGEGTRTGGDRYQVIVHTNEGTLSEQGDGVKSKLETGMDEAIHVSAETSRRVACDCSVVHMKQSEKGEPLSIGRKSRTVPPAIRRALKHRDGGCVFPGCNCRRFTDAHHIKHWADGGETSMDNLVLLCRRHHRLMHEGGFSVALKEGKAEFTSPEGQVIPENASGRFRGNVVQLRTQNEMDELGITPQTPVPRWRGEVMDRDLALVGLVQRD